MALFQKSVLANHLNSIAEKEILSGWEKFQDYKSISENIRTYKEEEFQYKFLEMLFVDCLGYKISEIRKSNNALTGCLTFHDIRLEDIDIISENSNCEDAIHFVRVKGNRVSIKITDALFDGIDADFSNILFNNINISNAGNDCVDLSFGKYEVKEARLSRCGDKGISVGEKSNVFFNKIKISNSNIGVASKDSSIVKINHSNIDNTKICLSAYRKKQEFNSAKINVKNLLCKNFNKKIEVDANSVIIVENQ